MKIFAAKRGWFLTAVFTMLMAIALPATAFGDDHGKREKARHLDKKCGKFINCHDARDGRRVARRLRRGPLVVDANGRLVRRDRDRDRDFDGNNLPRNRRIRERDRDDDNPLRNGRIRERDRDRDVDNDSRRHRRGKRHDDDNHNQ